MTKEKEEAITIIQGWMDGYTYDEGQLTGALEMAIKALEQEPKQGHWVRVAGGSLIDDYRCDRCQNHPPKKIVRNTWGWDFTDYCPSCGARMSEVSE